jgi:hypothetical protein
MPFTGRISLAKAIAAIAIDLRVADGIERRQRGRVQILLGTAGTEAAERHSIDFKAAEVTHDRLVHLVAVTARDRRARDAITCKASACGSICVTTGRPTFCASQITELTFEIKAPSAAPAECPDRNDVSRGEFEILRKLHRRPDPCSRSAVA